MTEMNLKKIEKHLELIGYTIITPETPDNFRLATHNEKGSFFFTFYQAHAKFFVFTHCKEGSMKKNWGVALELANILNTRTIVSSYSVIEDDGFFKDCFMIQAIYLPNYTKQSFSYFLKCLEIDINEFQPQKYPQLNKLLL